MLIGLTGHATQNGQNAGTARVGKDAAAMVIAKEGFWIRPFALPLKRAAQALFGLTDEETWSDDFKNRVIPDWGVTPRQIMQRIGTEGGRRHIHPDLWSILLSQDYDKVKAGAGGADLMTGTKSSRISACACIMLGLDYHQAIQAEEKGEVIEPFGITFNTTSDIIYRKIIHEVLARRDALEAYNRTIGRRPDGGSVPELYTRPVNPVGIVVPDVRFINEAELVRGRGGRIVHIYRELPADTMAVTGHASEAGIEFVEGDAIIQNNGSLADLRSALKEIAGHMDGRIDPWPSNQ